MKGLAGIATILIILGLVFGIVLFGDRLGINFPQLSGAPTNDQDEVRITTQCDDDGLVRLVAAYQDSLADDAASLSTADSFLYEVAADGSKSLILNQADETSATYGTFNEVGTNVLVCKKQYELWLGDEDENPFRSSGVFTATGSEKRVKINDGFIIGAETWSGFEQGTLETTTNITLGSGATATSLKLEYSSSTADQAHEAKDGLLFIANYNDTAWLRVEPTGVNDLNGKVTSSGAAIRSISCPDLVGRVAMTTTTDFINKCWQLPITFVADGGSFDIPIYLALESGVNPGVVAGAPDGGSITEGAVRFAILDENGFQNTEKPPSFPIEYGYQGDDEDNIGEPTMTRITVVFA